MKNSEAARSLMEEDRLFHAYINDINSREDDALLESVISDPSVAYRLINHNSSRIQRKVAQHSNLAHNFIDSIDSGAVSAACRSSHSVAWHVCDGIMEGTVADQSIMNSVASYKDCAEVLSSSSNLGAIAASCQHIDIAQRFTHHDAPVIRAALAQHDTLSYNVLVKAHDDCCYDFHKHDLSENCYMRCDLIVGSSVFIELAKNPMYAPYIARTVQDYYVKIEASKNHDVACSLLDDSEGIRFNIAQYHEDLAERLIDDESEVVRSMVARHERLAERLIDEDECATVRLAIASHPSLAIHFINDRDDYVRAAAASHPHIAPKLWADDNITVRSVADKFIALNNALSGDVDDIANKKVYISSDHQERSLHQRAADYRDMKRAIGEPVEDIIHLSQLGIVNVVV